MIALGRDTLILLTRSSILSRRTHLTNKLAARSGRESEELREKSFKRIKGNYRDPLHGGNRTVIRMVYTTAMQVRSFIES